MKQYNRHSLENTARAVDHTGVSSRAATLICNSYAMDMGWLTRENRLTDTLSKTKLDRWRVVERGKITKGEVKVINSRPIRGFYYDGKNTATLIKLLGKSGKFFPRSVIQDHYAIIKEPDGIFLGHVTPDSGQGISIAVAIFCFLKARGWEKDIVVIGCDGTNTNVGNVKGSIQYLEKLLGHSLEWNICLLNANELPFRAEFALYDGKTSGPSSFKGPLGKELQQDLTSRKPIRFAPIKNSEFPQLPEDVATDLSSDQEYLYDMSWAVIEGRVDDDLAYRQPGSLCHSRWLTMANRILLLYVTTRSPSMALKRMAFIVIQFYAPCWFWIKSHPKSIDGPKNLLKMIEFSRKLSKKEQEVAQKAIQRNAFYAHPEVILKTMLADEDEAKRKKAVSMILQLRAAKEGEQDEKGEEEREKEEDGYDEEDEEEEETEEEVAEEEVAEEGAKGGRQKKNKELADAFNVGVNLEPEELEAIQCANIRKFVVPKLNFHATDYPDLINWTETTFFEPPFTANFSDQDIRNLEFQPLAVPAFPCHTQSVERAIRLITEAASSVIGPEARDGFIRQRIKSRKEFGRCDGKETIVKKLEKE